MMRSRMVAALVAIGGGVLLAGCGGGGGGGGNRAPVIASLTASPTEVAPGGVSTVTCGASDPDGGAFTYTWTASGGTLSGSGASVRWTAPRVGGSYRVTVRVSDGTADATATETIQVHEPPSITEASLTPSELRFTGGTVTITVKATDDGTVAQVAAVVDGPPGASMLDLAASGDHYEATYPASANPGPTDDVYSVEVTATDDRGYVSAPRALTFTVTAPAAPPDAPWP